MGDYGAVAADWRDERIAELEAEGARKEARISELEADVARKDAQIAQLEGQVATLTAQVAALTKQVAELMERLGRNSRNSHLPPSSDPPGGRGPSGHGKDKQGGRKRGGQPGHGGSRRTLLPPEQVDEVVDVYPSHCEGCAERATAGARSRGTSVPAGRDAAGQAAHQGVALPRGRVPQVQAQDPCRRTTRQRSQRRPSARA